MATEVQCVDATAIEPQLFYGEEAAAILWRRRNLGMGAFDVHTHIEGMVRHRVLDLRKPDIHLRMAHSHLHYLVIEDASWRSCWAPATDEDRKFFRSERERRRSLGQVQTRRVREIRVRKLRDRDAFKYFRALDGRLVLQVLPDWIDLPFLSHESRGAGGIVCEIRCKRVPGKHQIDVDGFIPHWGDRANEIGLGPLKTRPIFQWSRGTGPHVPLELLDRDRHHQLLGWLNQYWVCKLKSEFAATERDPNISVHFQEHLSDRALRKHNKDNCPQGTGHILYTGLSWKPGFEFSWLNARIDQFWARKQEEEFWQHKQEPCPEPELESSEGYYVFPYTLEGLSKETTGAQDVKSQEMRLKLETRMEQHEEEDMTPLTEEQKKAAEIYRQWGNRETTAPEAAEALHYPSPGAFLTAYSRFLKEQTTSADSGRSRSRFRDDSDHHSCLIPISIPGRKRSLFRGQSDQ